MFIIFRYKCAAMLLAFWSPSTKHLYADADAFGGQGRSLNLRLACLIGAYALYLVLGAAVFSALEVPLQEVDHVQDQIQVAKQRMLAANPCVSREYTR